jgi:putative transposase
MGSESKAGLYVHMVWGTSQRKPLITPKLEPALLGCIEAEVQKLGCTVIALGGTDDHVHLLVQLAPSVSVASLAKQVKGASSHLLNSDDLARGAFRWQAGYGAFSLGRPQLEPVIGYVNRQREHHAAGRMWGQWEPSADAT